MCVANLEMYVQYIQVPCQIAHVDRFLGDCAALAGRDTLSLPADDRRHHRHSAPPLTHDSTLFLRNCQFAECQHVSRGVWGYWIGPADACR
jgi:hypothetical protein